MRVTTFSLGHSDFEAAHWELSLRSGSVPPQQRAYDTNLCACLSLYKCISVYFGFPHATVSSKTSSRSHPEQISGRMRAADRSTMHFQSFCQNHGSKLVLLFFLILVFLVLMLLLFLLYILLIFLLALLFYYSRAWNCRWQLEQCGTLCQPNSRLWALAS